MQRRARKHSGSTSSKTSPPGFNHSYILEIDVPEVEGPLLNASLQGHHNPSSFPEDLNLDFFKDRRNDAWNPLLVTTRLSGGGRHFEKDHRRSVIQDDVKSRQSSITSIYYGYSDSGYGSRDAQSVISSSSVQSPAVAPPHPLSDVRASGTLDSLLHRGEFKSRREGKCPTHGRPSFKCSQCDWIGKTPSEKKKHEARHRKAYKCEEPGCSAKGFGTRNDLERHRKTVHSKTPRCGPVEVYKCFGPGCHTPSKLWPRMDNFLVHLRCRHPKEDTDKLLEASKNWHKTWKDGEQSQTSTAFDPVASPSRQSLPMLDLPHEFLGGVEGPTLIEEPTETMAPADAYYASSSNFVPHNLTLSPIKTTGGSEMEHSSTTHKSSAEGVGASMTEKLAQDGERTSTTNGEKAVTLPALNTLDLSPVPGQEPVPSVTTSFLDSPGIQAQATQDGRSIQEVMEVMNILTLHAVKKTINDTYEKQTMEGPKQVAAREQIMHAHQKGSESISFPLPTVDGDALSTIQHLPDDFKKFLYGVASTVTAQLAEGFSKTDRLQCKVCGKETRRMCELRKHMARHKKAYGCTFPQCYKRFGSKADWKRHENTLHFHDQSYRCSLPRNQHEECAELFWRVEQYTAHLRDVHGADEDSAIMREHPVHNRIGRNGQSQYWCGFCRKIIPLKKRGLDAWNERFDHIDFEHFRKGQTIGHWLPASGHTSKGALRRRHRQKLRAKQPPTRPPGASGNGDLDSLPDDSESVDSGGEYTVCSSSDEDSTCDDSVEGTRRPAQAIGGKSNNGSDSPFASSSATAVVVGSSDDGEELPPKKLKSVHEQPEAVYCCNCQDGPQNFAIIACCTSCQHTFCRDCAGEDELWNEKAKNWIS